MQITQGLLLVFAILLEIPIAMIFVSRILKPGANRWANTVAAAITSVFVVGGGSMELPFYAFFATVEVACMALIVWSVWSRRSSESRDTAYRRASVGRTGSSRDRRITMKAVIQTGYGSADVMKLKEVEKPTPGDGEVLVRVVAASLAAGEYFGMRGKPFPIRFYIGFPTPKKDFVVGTRLARESSRRSART